MLGSNSVNQGESCNVSASSRGQRRAKLIKRAARYLVTTTFACVLVGAMTSEARAYYCWYEYQWIVTPFGYVWRSVYVCQ